MCIARRPSRIGEFLVAIGKMTPEQVDQVQRAQKAGDKRRFGEIALALGFIGDDSIKRFVDFLETNPKGASP
jgi:hypothetical protein